ncbi:hypothetical protein D3C75_1187450 [compost metagenome]
MAGGGSERGHRPGSQQSSGYARAGGIHGHPVSCGACDSGKQAAGRGGADAAGGGGPGGLYRAGTLHADYFTCFHQALQGADH